MWDSLRRLFYRGDLSQKERNKLLLDEALEEVLDEIEPGDKTPQRPLTDDEYEAYVNTPVYKNEDNDE